MRALLVALALFALPAAAAEPAPAPADVARLAIEGYIRPAFGDFAAAAAALETASAALCPAPSEAALAGVRKNFLAALDGFARVSFLRFGPLTGDNRVERLLLWPDPKGIALRQVQALLAEMPADALDPENLTHKSVALQGFNALEFVLFGTGAEALATTPDSYRCHYGASVAAAIDRIADEVQAAWADPAGFSRRLVAPAAADADYRSAREVLEELVGAMSHGAEAVRDTYLLPFLGRDGAAPKPRSAPLWRSNGTPALAAGALEGIAGMAAAMPLGVVAGEKGPFIAQAIAFEGTNVRRAAAAVTGSVEAALADPHQLQGYRYLVVLTQSLQDLIGTELSAALGLSVGFSSLDGD
jgi:predicted lipoprotein